MMFNMKIGKQLNIENRTLPAGQPQFDIIPNTVEIDKKVYTVLGVSQGIKLPYMSIEIERTEKELVGYDIKGI